MKPKTTPPGEVGLSPEGINTTMRYGKYSTPPQAASIPAHSQALTCRRCGCIATPLVQPGSGPHWHAAACQHCGGFMQWLSQYPPAEREARRAVARNNAPPTAPQVAYLRALGDAGPAPVTRRDASERIGALLAAREVQP